MKSWMFRLISALLLIVMVSACAPAATTPAMAEEPTMEEATMMPEATHSAMDEMMDETPTADMMETHPAMDETSAADDMMHETPMSDDEMMETPAADDMMEMPAWVDAALTNVSSGETLKVSDFRVKLYWSKRWRSGAPPASASRETSRNCIPGWACPITWSA